MDVVAVDYRTLVHAGAVLDRQAAHARRIETYLRAEGDITEATGFLLAALRPLSKATVQIGAHLCQATAAVASTGATQVQRTTASYADADRTTHERLTGLARQVGASTQRWSDPRDAVPALGPAATSARPGHGDSSSWMWQKAADAGSGVGGMVRDVVDIGRDVTAWTGPARPVHEAVDPSSFLVPPTSGENVVQDLRWSAGVLLGSVDWVAEQVLGWSVLEECVFKPFGGDWRSVQRSSAAWEHAGSAFMGVGRNCAALVPATVQGWEGLAGDAFRVAITALSATTGRVALAFDAVSGAVSTVATVTRLACSGVGTALRKISHILLQLAAELAIPVAGWAVGAVTFWWKVERVIGLVRLVYNLIEGIMDAVNGMVQSRERLVEAARLVEDLAEGAARRTVQAVTP